MKLALLRIPLRGGLRCRLNGQFGKSADSRIQNRGLDLLHQLSQSAARDYLEHLLSLIVNLTSELIGCEICSIMILDPEKEVFTVKATQSLDTEYLEKRPLKIKGSLSGQAILKRTSLQWKDVTKEKGFQYLPMAKRLGLKSLLTVPMLAADRPLGVINFYTTQVREFSPTEIRFLEAMANQATLAFEKHNWEDQAKKMEKALQERKLIEKAKGILMEKKSLSEKEAFELLRKASMDSRKSMEELAQAIVLTENI